MTLLLVLVGAGGGISADLTATEAGDTLSSSAVLPVQATLSVTEAGDTLSSSAQVSIQASLSSTEDDDTLSATSVLSSSSISADLSVTEEGDSLVSLAALPSTNGNRPNDRDRIINDDEMVMREIFSIFNKLAA